MRLDFGGINAIAVPNATEVASAAFVAEGAPIPLGQAAFVAATLGPVKKLGLIAGISREVQEYSPDNASNLIGRLMSQGAGRALDRQVFSANPASSAAPAGLLFGVTPIPAGTSMAADLGSLVGGIANANVLGDIVLACHPSRALLLSLLSFGALALPVITSNQIDSKTIIAIATDGIASGYDAYPR
jgi:hypothetical protein